MLPLVLIHGASGTKRDWDLVLPSLSRPNLAINLPGREGIPGDLDTLTVSDFAASVVQDMDAAGIDRAVIVGHSLAGLTIVTMAELIPERIERMVFVNCVVPPDGKGNFDLVGPIVKKMVNKYGVADDGRSLHPDAILEYYCGGMSEEQIEFVLGCNVKDAGKPLHQPVSLSGLMKHPIPGTWIIGTRDLVVTPEIQRIGIEALRKCGCPMEIVEIDAGHLANVSHASELAQILNSV